MTPQQKQQIYISKSYIVEFRIYVVFFQLSWGSKIAVLKISDVELQS